MKLCRRALPPTSSHRANNASDERLCYTAHMAKVTIAKRTYDRLKREAAAWRNAMRSTTDLIIFNADRDNGGKGIEAGILADKLRALMQ